jgi:uncharacterized membrane protein YidH (DUF202 family)
MAGVEEGNRSRIAVVLGVIGAILVILGLALIIQQMEQTSFVSPRTPVAEKKVVNARVIQSMLFLLLVLVGVFAVASLAFLRWSRRFRRWLLHKPRPATPNADVWLMHRLPEDLPDEPDTEFGPADSDEDDDAKPG